ncbi:PAS domain-containing protein, partial [Nonomuraea fuscirosea]
MSEISRRPVALAPLSPGLSPQTMAWVTELRAQFAALGISICLFSRLHPIDKGTVSRYLSGKRVPTDRWFLDKILALRTASGESVTEEVREHLTNLQLAALQVAHPHEYRLRKATDELDIAVTRWKEAERYAHNLERQLNERTHALEAVLAETDRLRVAWDHDRAQYLEEIARLTEQLALARGRALKAEERVQEMEALLSQLETQQPDEGGSAADIVDDQVSWRSATAYMAAAQSQVVWITSPAGVAIEDAPQWRAITGQGLEEYLTSTWLGVVHPEERQRTENAWREARREHNIFEWNCRVRTRASGYRHFEVRAVPIIRHGRLVEWVGVNTDVTRQREAEEMRGKLTDQLGAATLRTARLQGATAMLAEALTVEQVAQVIIDVGRTALAADRSAVALLDTDRAALKLING